MRAAPSVTRREDQPHTFIHRSDFLERFQDERLFLVRHVGGHDDPYARWQGQHTAHGRTIGVGRSVCRIRRQVTHKVKAGPRDPARDQMLNVVRSGEAEVHMSRIAQRVVNHVRRDAAGRFGDKQRDGYAGLQRVPGDRRTECAARIQYQHDPRPYRSQKSANRVTVFPGNGQRLLTRKSACEILDGTGRLGGRHEASVRPSAHDLLDEGTGGVEFRRAGAVHPHGTLDSPHEQSAALKQIRQDGKA